MSSWLPGGAGFSKDLKRKANVSRSLRLAMHPRNRPLRRQYEIGEWVYYWRKADQESSLMKVHWKGPALVTNKEYHEDEEMLMESVV
eukprot:7806276-Karenia_brevis.AAC.1